MTSPELPPLSEAQLEIVNIVWDRGKATVEHLTGSFGSGRFTTLVVRNWPRLCIEG
jgi:hypothetical protein